MELLIAYRDDPAGYNMANFLSQKMTLDGVVTHEFPLEEVNQAIELFRSGDAGRIILRMN